MAYFFRCHLFDCGRSYSNLPHHASYRFPYLISLRCTISSLTSSSRSRVIDRRNLSLRRCGSPSVDCDSWGDNTDALRHTHTHTDSVLRVCEDMHCCRNALKKAPSARPRLLWLITHTPAKLNHRHKKVQ